MKTFILTVMMLLFPTTLSAQSSVLTIADYPRYGTGLDASQQEDLRKFARAIVGALLAGNDIELSIYGHADFDAKGRDFEMQVSQERAKAADEALRDMVYQEAMRAGLPASRLQSMRILQVTGLGTVQAIYDNPQGGPESPERRANRRVDFIYSSLPQAPTIQPSIFTRCISALGAGGPPGPVRRMRCACNMFEQDPTSQDTHYNFEARRLIPGAGGMPKLSPADWDAAMRELIFHMRQQIKKAADSSISDADFAQVLLSLDDTVGRNINNFYIQQTGAAAMGLFDRVILDDILWRMNDPKHVYHCYAGYSRKDHEK